ncbi:MAG: polyprenyl synthetase family protein [Pseudomonadota bacterium]
MDNAARIEQALERSISAAVAHHCPPKLAAAVQHAVFPGGARVRPQLCLAVAAACGDAESPIVDGAATAIELLHCASLVHDDLPCFDDSDLRRGKPSVHARFGEEIAVLAGDALIVQAFHAVARSAAAKPQLLPDLVALIADCVGMNGGITAGQAWESEDVVDVNEYHCAKTGSLFVGAVTAGAMAVGSDPQLWRQLGLKIGEAYQLADDLLDASGTQAECGKPVGQDTQHGRPNAVAAHGVGGTVKLLGDTLKEAVASIPDCEGHAELSMLIVGQAKRLVPASLAAQAA